MRKILLALLFAGLVSQASAADNYNATAGAGLTFGAKDAAGILYSRFIGCDNTTVSQCWAVDASGRLTVNINGTVTVTGAGGTFPITAASGALASGAFAAGSGVDGWDLTQGAKADSVCATDTGTCSIAALVKKGNANLTTLNATASAAAAISPALGGATPAFTFLALPATTTTQIIALSGVTVTYVTSIKVLAGGTVNVTLKYGTGSNCGTGTTTLDGPYPLTTQTGWAQGAGTGAVLIVPSGKALCITTDASVSGGVSVTYQQI